jgi:hypothetical protein
VNWRDLISAGAAIAVAGALAPDESWAQGRKSLFPENHGLYPRSSGCSPTSRLNPCGGRSLPTLGGSQTDGPLTDPFDKGPLDPKDDPLNPGTPLTGPDRVVVPTDQKLKSQQTRDADD